MDFLQMDMRELFNKLYFAQTEGDVDELLNTHTDIFKSENWYPLGGNENNFGVIENQQSNPIAALIEKITNSIDALLMKKCLEAGIDPKSPQAPQSMEEAKVLFFKRNEHWDLPNIRKKQAESIQIIADGPRFNTSLIIYDDGEGQHPEDFENTFLSLLEGNKTEIHFVQGKYNMGGSGAIVFCGKKRYQLIGSKRYDSLGQFGFTLIREHPLSITEQRVNKNTWYEYLKIDQEIPAFHVNQLNLGLYNRQYITGSIIKMYSYALLTGSRSVISKDLRDSLNEYLFEPVLPIITVDKKERYPHDYNLERDLYGLKRRLEQDDSKYVEDFFSYEFEDELFGTMKATCYVFKTIIDDKLVKETKDIIRKEFFKNNMSVLFSVNGQVHAHYTSEFITRSLKMNLFKDYLLIHVDCTNMNYNFRRELFMASRDRFRGGIDTQKLRDFLAKKLGNKNGRLAEIHQNRIDSLGVHSEDTKDLLKSFAQNFSRNPELLNLLDQTLNFDLKPKGSLPRISNNLAKKKQRKKDKHPFKPQRYPAFFKRRTQGKTDKEFVTIPFGGEKTIYFDTDVENNYFDRTEDPGELKIGVLDYKTNETEGGNCPGEVNRIEDLFNAQKSSPKNGTIQIHLNPNNEVRVGDEVKIRASLNDPSGSFFQEIFLVKISEPKAPQQTSPKTEKKEIPNLGLPEYILVYEKDWENFDKGGIIMDHSTVMYPAVDGENLKTLYINMDSTVLKNFRRRNGNLNQENLDAANQRYIATVYSHTLFLYSITKAHKYKIMQEDSNDQEIDLEIYIKNLFENHYAEFLLNYGFDEIMQLCGD